MEMMDQDMSEIKKSTDWLDRAIAAARLALTDEERARLAVDVSAEMMDLSGAFDAATECWQGRAIGLDALREDRLGTCLCRKDLLGQSAFHDDACFLVPRVLGSEGETS